jgi:nitric oxide synthase-interacting protein
VKVPFVATLELTHFGAVAMPCGHVVCKPCVDKFVTATPDDPHDQSDKSMQCYVCEADLTNKAKPSKKDKDKVHPGLVLIQSDGTGFSAGGGNVTTEKQGVAFQC